MGMRITQRMTNRMYQRNNNLTMTNLSNAYKRIITQAKYTRNSESPLNSEKAMSIRKGLRELDTWDDNISTAHELFTTAESSLSQVASNLFTLKVKPLLVQGSTTTVGDVGMAAVGTQLRQTAEEMVDAMNADFNERQMFGGLSQNKTPFTIVNIRGASTLTDDLTADGTVLAAQNYVQGPDGRIYREDDGYTISAGNELLDPDGNVVIDSAGYPVAAAGWTYGELVEVPGGVAQGVCYNDILMTTIKEGADGLFYGTRINDDGTQTEDELVPGQGQVLLDIGLGIEFDTNLNVNPNTAFDTAMHGFKILGYGVDHEGYATNLIQLTLDAAAVAEQGDIKNVELLSTYIDKTDEASTNIRTFITELGVRYTSLDYYTTKNEDSRTALMDRQLTVEGTDIYKEITDYFAIQAAYDASLQMGANILPKSIFDFI
ncbi:MAG: flagellin [Ruminococcus sp.]|jgi:flagellin-like hook-associated protein FlgL|nr:flagellin [Ruminococcus sp.]